MNFVFPFLFYLCFFFLDNHDLISLKLYELSVERSPEEEEEQQEITLPSVDYRADPNGNTVTKRLYLHYMFRIRYLAEEYISCILQMFSLHSLRGG